MPYLEPFDYQQKGIDFAFSRPASAIIGAIGSGKSVIALSTINEWINAALASKVLIVAPPSVITDMFPLELEKWDQFKHLKYEVLHGPKKDERIRRPADIYLCTYHDRTLQWLFTHRYCPRFDAIVLDESHNVKAQSTKRFKMLKVVMPYIPQKIIMTGTLAGNTLVDLWAQFYLLDGGKRLFNAENAFKHWWFVPGKKVNQWFPKRGARQEIAEKISDIAYEIDISQVKLPKLREEIISITLPRPVMKLYRKLEKEAFIELADTGARISAFNIRAMFQKTRQAASGFLYDADKVAHFLHDEKIKAIKKLIEQAGDESVMIVCDFKEEPRRLRKVFPDMGWLNGDTTPKQRKRFISEWNSKKLKKICIHPQSGGEGINLQHGGRLQIWSSFGWSSIRHKQTVGRLWRTGQESDEVIVRYLVAKDTIDEPMLMALKSHAKDIKAFLKLLRAYQSR